MFNRSDSNNRLCLPLAFRQQWHHSHIKVQNKLLCVCIIFVFRSQSSFHSAPSYVLLFYTAWTEERWIHSLCVWRQRPHWRAESRRNPTQSCSTNTEMEGESEGEEAHINVRKSILETRAATKHNHHYHWFMLSFSWWIMNCLVYKMSENIHYKCLEHRLTLSNSLFALA